MPSLRRHAHSWGSGLRWNGRRTYTPRGPVQASLVAGGFAAVFRVEACRLPDHLVRVGGVRTQLHIRGPRRPGNRCAHVAGRIGGSTATGLLRAMNPILQRMKSTRAGCLRGSVVAVRETDLAFRPSVVDVRFEQQHSLSRCRRRSARATQWASGSGSCTMPILPMNVPTRGPDHRR